MHDVVDKSESNRFELSVDGHTAFVTYRIVGGIVTLDHAEVPVHLEGRGIGSRLVRGTLEVLRARNMKVVPRCPFIAAFIRKNSEFRDMLAQPR
jgi:predicted GNAT family acetyltransferase